MILDKQITTLIQTLRCYTSFEDAAVIVLRLMLQLVDNALQTSNYQKSAKLQRGIMHLRPTGGYRGLVVFDYKKNALIIPKQEAVNAAIYSSATTWRLIETHANAIAVDVSLGQFEIADDSTINVIDNDNLAPAAFEGLASLQRFSNRGTTHLYAIPLLGPGNTIHGIVSLEVRCRSAIGRHFIWSDCAKKLQLIADLATPTLIALPLHTAPTITGDPKLPVIGASMTNLINLLKVFTQQDETILISGPTGTGKSRLAAWCHTQSLRSDGPFLTLDLLSVPEEMQMGELYGWKKGAFTGAVKDQQGCVTRAEGGTLFIDEIDKLSLKAQASLLQLLETRQYRVLGEPGSSKNANIRFIIGTNADLKEAVAEGNFREDLYYRINVLPVRLPPLAERKDEIPAWADFMITRRHEEVGKNGTAKLSADATLVLIHYLWPGNLRQLDNVLRRAYAMALADGQFTDNTIIINKTHIDNALNFETNRKDDVLIAALQHAAAAYVDEAILFAERGETLDIKHIGVLRGLVLETALQRFKDLKKVYQLFGHHRLLAGRNHTQDYRRETGKVKQLGELLGRVIS